MKKILEETTFIMKKYSITANKSLGQNFLIEDEIIEKMIQSANVQKEDLIIEIGPGLGTLTRELLEKAKKVIAIELDDRMITILRDRFQLYHNFDLIHEDVLKVNLQELIQNNITNSNQKVKIVANLPYYITTPILMKLLEDRLSIESITVMVQKEVADRIIAIPGEKNTGAITYSIHYYANPSEVAFVSKECFIPSPEVDSKVMRLEIRKEPPVAVKDEKLFFTIIKASFMQRRKTLLNGLYHGGIIKSKEEGQKLLEDLKIPINIRGENLSLAQFAKIADKIILWGRKIKK